MESQLQHAVTLTTLSLFSLLLSSTSWASPLGTPIATADEGGQRITLGMHGESAPGSLSSLPTRTIRYDRVLKEGLGLFADATWTNKVVEQVGGVRNRTWTTGGGVVANVYPTSRLTIGFVGRAAIGTTWNEAPDYLSGGTTSEPLIPAFASGEVSDLYRKLSGRAAALLIFGSPGDHAYLWVGPHLTLTGTIPVTASESKDVWTWNADQGTLVGATIGAELLSADISGVADPRMRRLAIGLESHIFDVNSISLWLGLTI
jgi:hypothetical protein